MIQLIYKIVLFRVVKFFAKFMNFLVQNLIKPVVWIYICNLRSEFYQETCKEKKLNWHFGFLFHLNQFDPYIILIRINLLYFNLVYIYAYIYIYLSIDIVNLC